MYIYSAIQRNKRNAPEQLNIINPYVLYPEYLRWYISSIILIEFEVFIKELIKN